MENYYANTKNQPLDQHLFAVGICAYQLIKRLVTDDNLAISVFHTGCLHDVGKIDPLFQNWINTKTGQHIDKTSGIGWFEKHPRHNEISLLLYYLRNSQTDTNKQNDDRITHTIFWHHAKPIRKKGLDTIYSIYEKLENNLTADQLTLLINDSNQLIADIDLLISKVTSEALYPLAISFGDMTDDQAYKFKDVKIPKYKKYFNSDNLKNYRMSITLNAKNNLARTALVTADRLISALSSEALLHHIENETLNLILDEKLTQYSTLPHLIQNCLDGFEKTQLIMNETNSKLSLL